MTHVLYLLHCISYYLSLPQIKILLFAVLLWVQHMQSSLLAQLAVAIILFPQ